MFDEYEVNTEDYSQLKKDTVNHPRTSPASLRLLARATYAFTEDTKEKRRMLKKQRDPYQRASRFVAWPKGSTKVTDSLQDCLDWLNLWRNELPSELETEEGRLLSARREINEANYGMDDMSELDTAELSPYEQHGHYYVGDTIAFCSLEDVFWEHVDNPEDKSWGPYEHYNMLESLAIRGEMYKEHAERQAKRNRWRGMEEYDAVEKANEKLREGFERATDTANAKPLPPVKRLHQLFLYDAESDALVRRIRQGRANAGDLVGDVVRIDGSDYKTPRVKYAMQYGDPADKMVINGQATNYRRATGWVSLRDDGNFDARVKLSKEDITIGEYTSKTKATDACRLYLRSLEMGLR